MNSLPESNHTRNSDEYIQAHRVRAITRIAQECTPAYIAQVIARAGDGDPDVLSSLAWDFLTLDDLRDLLQSRARVTDVLERFKWQGRWVSTEPRLFVVTPSLDRYMTFIQQHELDPYRVFHYPDPDEAREHVAINQEHGIETEVIVMGGAA